MCGNMKKQVASHSATVLQLHALAKPLVEDFRQYYVLDTDGEEDREEESMEKNFVAEDYDAVPNGPPNKKQAPGNAARQLPSLSLEQRRPQFACCKVGLQTQSLSNLLLRHHYLQLSLNPSCMRMHTLFMCSAMLVSRPRNRRRKRTRKSWRAVPRRLHGVAMFWGNTQTIIY